MNTPTREEIIRWAREADPFGKTGSLHPIAEKLARISYAAGEAAKREACAQIAECHELGTPEGHAIAAAIRTIEITPALAK